MGDVSSFAFTISLAAVINGLGLVRLLTALATYTQGRHKVTHYWVYALLLFFQFLMHILLWWAMFGTRAAGTLNFLQYLYLLVGPIIMFLSTSMLLPDIKDGAVDMRALYSQVVHPYFAVTSLLWLWAIFLWPILVGAFAPAWPIFMGMFFLALVLRFSTPNRAHAFLVPVYCVAILVFIALYQLELGGPARQLMESVQ